MVIKLIKKMYFVDFSLVNTRSYTYPTLYEL